MPLVPDEGDLAAATASNGPEESENEEDIFSSVLEQSEFNFSELKNNKICTAGMLHNKKSRKEFLLY